MYFLSHCQVPDGEDVLEDVFSQRLSGSFFNRTPPASSNDDCTHGLDGRKRARDSFNSIFYEIWGQEKDRGASFKYMFDGKFQSQSLLSKEEEGKGLNVTKDGEEESTGKIRKNLTTENEGKGTVGSGQKMS